MVTNDDYKLYGSLLGLFSNGFLLKVQFFVRDEKIYRALANGESLKTYHAMWILDEGEGYIEHEDDEELKLTRTTAEKDAVEGKDSVWNLESGSTTGMDIACNPDSESGYN